MINCRLAFHSADDFNTTMINGDRLYSFPLPLNMKRFIGILKLNSNTFFICIGGDTMGVSKKGKRKIIVGEKIYWWFVDDVNWDEPFARIIADDHSFEAECNLYRPVLRIAKDNNKGRRSISIPSELSDKYLNFTPQYISDLIRIGSS